MYYPFDPIFMYLVLPAMLFSIWASMMVKKSFKKYALQTTANGLTGADAAHEVLRRAGVNDVRIERVPGNLTDHFDPKERVIRLSEDVFDKPSVAAVGVAAHEAGHAVQHATGYKAMKVRTAIAPVTSIGSRLSMPLILMGILFSATGLFHLGIIMFALVVVFQLITLPVEFNASSRAITALSDSALLTEEELPASKKVLSAAAMTYVAALALSTTQLIRMLALSRRRR